MKKCKYEVIVYSGKSHWDKPIDEICNVFETRREAERAAKVIEKYNPNYYIEIVESNAK